MDTGQYFCRVKRLSDIIHCPNSKALCLLIGCIDGRDEYDVDLPDAGILFQVLTHFKATHLRHHDIEKYQVRELMTGKFQGLGTVKLLVPHQKSHNLNGYRGNGF